MHAYRRKQSQLVAVYGRRRVGKTYLVRELFKNEFAFYHTGVSPVELKDENLLEVQLREFNECPDDTLYDIRAKTRHSQRNIPKDSHA